MDIRLIGIAKRFGPAPAIDGIDLAIRSGELVALLGPSGSGKTTLLRVVAGLEKPDAGQVMFGDEDATGIPVARRRVGFVFQHYALFRHLNVSGNIAYGLRARGRQRPSSAAIRDRVDELLRLTQLEGLSARFPAELSGGQRQRVALARALAVDPRVLLLDEPFGALDARVRRDLRRSLRRIHDATGQTTIFVTHDQDEALELADRIAILQGGRLEQVGTPDEILDRPASRFVSSFVGNAAELPVTISDGVVRYGEVVLPIERGGCPDGSAILSLRASDVALTADGAGGLTGTVVSARRQDRMVRAEIRVAGPTDPVVEVLSPPDAVMTRGAVVAIRVVGGRVFAG